MRVRTLAKRQSHHSALRAQAARFERSASEVDCRSRSLLSYLHEASEAERKRLADALHDELGGVLTSAKADLHWLRQGGAQDGPTLQRFERLAKALDEAVAIERNAVEGLRPSLLDHLGLGTALDWYLRGIGQRTALDCRCGDLAHADSVPAERAIIVYRLVQEALANVLDAERSSRVELTIERNERGLRLHLEEDTDSFADGLPLRHQQRLASMHARARSLGGSLEVHRPDGGGTHIDLVFPTQS